MHQLFAPRLIESAEWGQYLRAITLVLRRRKMARESPEGGTGLGLSNLNSRYQLLLNREIEIINNDKVFSVRLPIVKPDE